MASRQVGPYRLRRRLSRDDGGTVHRAVGPTGGTVLLVQPSAGPPEAVAAFVHRVNAMAASGIENSSVYDSAPWAAVSASRPDVAWGLLGRSVPASVPASVLTSAPDRPPQPVGTTTDGDRLGSAGAASTRLPPTASEAGYVPRHSARRPRVALVGVVIGAVTGVVITGVVFGVVFTRRPAGPITLPTAPVSSAEPTPYGPRPTRDPVRGARPDVPMLSHTWSSTDSTYRMRLGGVPFAFLAPGDWGCMARGTAAHVAWTCINEHSTDTVPSVLRLFIEPCPSCSTARQRAVVDAVGTQRQLRSDLWASTRSVDARTRVAERHLTGQAAVDTWPHQYTLIRLLDDDQDGRTDAIMVAAAFANDDDRTGTEKMLGDLYDGSR